MFDWIANATVRTVRRVIIGVAGGTIVLAGLAMLVLPGPGIVTIGFGLALLSLEFAFAQRWLRSVQARAAQAADNAGIPKRHRIWFPIGGLVMALLMMILPGLFTVVRTSEGWLLLRNDRFTYAHSWTSMDRLERAADGGDERAERLLQSVHRRLDARHREAPPPTVPHTPSSLEHSP